MLHTIMELIAAEAMIVFAVLVVRAELGHFYREPAEME